MKNKTPHKTPKSNKHKLKKSPKKEEKNITRKYLLKNANAYKQSKIYKKQRTKQQTSTPNTTYITLIDHTNTPTNHSTITLPSRTTQKHQNKTHTKIPKIKNQ